VVARGEFRGRTQVWKVRESSKACDVPYLEACFVVDREEKITQDRVVQVLTTRLCKYIASFSLSPLRYRYFALCLRIQQLRIGARFHLLRPPLYHRACRCHVVSVGFQQKWSAWREVLVGTDTHKQMVHTELREGSYNRGAVSDSTFSQCACP